MSPKFLSDTSPMETVLKMIDYLNYTLLFLFGDVDLQQIKQLNFPYLIFLFSTSFIGLLCVLLDFAYYKVTNGNSIFNLSYIGVGPTLLMFLFWGVGSGIVGFLSVRLDLFAFSINSSIVMGLGWPLVFPRLYKYAKENIENGVPEESSGVEIEDEPEEVFEGEEEDKDDE